MRYLLVLVLLVACGATPATTGSVLDGTYNNPLGSVTIDTTAKTFTSVFRGTERVLPLEIVSERGNTTTVTIGGKTNTITRQDDGSLLIAEEGAGVPMVLKPAN